MKQTVLYIFYFFVSMFFMYSMVSCYDVDVKVTKKRELPHYTLEDIELGSLDQKEQNPTTEDKKTNISNPSTLNTQKLEKNNSSSSRNDSNLNDDFDIVVNTDTSDPSNTSDTPISSNTSDPSNTSNISDTKKSSSTSSTPEVVNQAPKSSSQAHKYLCSNPYLPQFVERLSLSEVKDLNKTLIQNVCNNPEYHKFFEKDFGWSGNPDNKNSYVQIFKQRKINDITFEFIVGMSFLLPKTEGSYLNDIFKAYTDSDWFQKHYVHPDNINIKLENINRSLDQKGFDISYTMYVSIMKVLSTSFKSNFIATVISDNFTVFTERSFDDEKSLMKRKHISFLNTEDKNFDHFVVFEYRILNVKASALSSIAKTFMDTMDSNMMDAVYQNAELRKNSLK